MILSEEPHAFPAAAAAAAAAAADADADAAGRAALASALGEFDTATVHEAHGRRGALPSVIKPVDPSFRLCGPAFTVACPGGDNLWIHRALYAASPGDVLVVATGGWTEAGHWGEILSHAAIACELAGLVIDGGVRDVERLGAVGFPVFSAAVCIRGTTKDPALPGALGRPVSFADTAVHTGDVVIGDRDGVVAIPALDVATVADAARRRVAAETHIIHRLQAGETTLDIYGLPQVR